TDNEQVELVEKRGLLAESLPGMMREMAQYARLSPRCKNFMHIVSFNPEPRMELTDAQWEQVYEIYDRHRGIPPGQPGFTIKHVKKGREHRHRVSLRVNLATLRALPDGFDFPVCRAAQKEVEEKLGLTPGPQQVTFGGKVKSWERMRGAKTGIDPHQVEAEVMALLRQSENGQAFKAALEAHGYLLITGKRGLLVLDRAGKEHSLARRCGLPMKELLAFMHDVDLKALPTVEQDKAQHRTRKAEAGRTAPNQAAPQQRQEPQPSARRAPARDDQAAAAYDTGANSAHAAVTFPDLPLMQAQQDPAAAAPVYRPARDNPADVPTDYPRFTTASDRPKQDGQEHREQPAAEHASREHDATGAARRDARGVIKQLWRKLRQALTEPEGDEPKPKARRRGESEGDFRRLGRMLGRRFNVRQSFRKVARKRLPRRLIIRLTREAWGPPDAHLITTPITNNESDCGNSFDAAIARNSHGNNYLSPSSLALLDRGMVANPTHTHTAYAFSRQSKKVGRLLECGTARIDKERNIVHVFMNWDADNRLHRLYRARADGRDAAASPSA
ncbi:MAG: hypothetical protein JO095_19780, partial [Alphaproteobacteria bacterium]|nr:hypothetical protein [Alphaproteobacteria bacterium]